MSLALITATGDRPGPFSRTERWMERQTFPWQGWYVADDGIVPTRCSLGQTHIRMESGKEAKASFAANYRTLLMAARSHDFVAVIEDDDAYTQDYLARLIPLLANHELAGESEALYFHVRKRTYRNMLNGGHASLCQTVFRGSLVPTILSLIDEQSAFIDMKLWRLSSIRKILKPSRCSVGLKGQSGRGGIGIGHRGEGPGWFSDPQGDVLRKRLGDEMVDSIFMEESLPCG